MCTSVRRGNQTITNNCCIQSHASVKCSWKSCEDVYETFKSHVTLRPIVLLMIAVQEQKAVNSWLWQCGSCEWNVIVKMLIPFQSHSFPFPPAFLFLWDSHGTHKIPLIPIPIHSRGVNFPKTWSGPILVILILTCFPSSLSQQTFSVVGSRPKVRVEIGASVL